MSTQLQNKLLHYAPEPPEKVWEAIVNSLEESASPLSEKLYHFEATPSTEVWDKINSQLDAVRFAKVVPFLHRYKKVVRYSTAVAVVTFLAITTTLLIGKQTQSETTSQQAQVQQPTSNSKTSAAPTQKDGSNGEVFLANIGETKINTQPSTASEKRNVLHRLRPPFQLASVEVGENFVPEAAEIKQTVNTDLPVEKYMVYSDADGNAMKLPKKLFDFISCVQEDVNCKQQLQQLQQKFASTALTTDFTGVLELLKNLKENQ